MISEVKKQIRQIETQIETEQKIHAIYTKYKDCPMKTAVIHQSIGVVRGLEIAKESLEYILAQHNPMKDQLNTDEWLLHDQKMKEMADQVDHRGGIVNEYRVFHHPDGRDELKVKKPDGEVEKLL